MNWNTKFIQIILKSKVRSLITGRKTFFVEDLIEHEIVEWGKFIKKKTKENISLSTLKRILRQEYDFESRAAGVRKRLTAIALTFGYKNWELFLSENIPSFQTRLYSVSEPPNHYSDVATTLVNAKNAEYNAYKNSPDVDTSELKEFYFENDPELAVIHWTLEKKEQAKCYLQQSTSFYTIKLVDLRVLYSDVVLVETKEEWYLVWKHTASHKTIEINDQNLSKTYCLYQKSETDKWCILSDVDFMLQDDHEAQYKFIVK